MRAFLFIITVIRRFEYCRVVIAIPMHCLEICPDEAASFLEISRLVDLLFAPLNLGLHTAPGLAPFPEISVIFLISTLIRQLLVLMRVPNLL